MFCHGHDKAKVAMHVGKVVTLTLVVIALATPGHLEVNARSVVEDLKVLESYLDELDFIEEQDKLRAFSEHGGSDLPEEDAWLQACDLMVQEEVKVIEDDDFNATVKEALFNWNRCLGHWIARCEYADWNYATDLSPENNDKLSDVQVKRSQWQQKLMKNAKRYKADDRYADLDTDSHRQLRLLAFGTEPTKTDDIRALVGVQNELQNIYSSATVSSEHGPLTLEPNLTKIIADSRNGRSLLLAWKGWRDVTGPPMRKKYTEMVRLLNVGARDNDIKDYADAWMTEQFDDIGDIEHLSETLWQEMRPLYEQLHAYVREKLSHRCHNDMNYCDSAEYFNYFKIFKSGGIPAHLTGNMWAQTWENIYDIVKPYPEINEPDYDEEMKDQHYDVDRLFSTAEKFYTSVGLFPMTETFNKYSMKVRPSGKNVVCHASASDFFTEGDFRIKMCTEIDMEYFETIHHEMGHIEYFMAYKDQPPVYRDGANSAFHEAIGDTISLSVLTTPHLKTIGLSKEPDDLVEDSDINQNKRDINYLMKRALFKIAFLPFAYMIDKWRWDVFKNVTTESDYNKHWWELRLKYQGIISPVERSEDDFDAGAKYHVSSNAPYICYFISFISQFQFYEAMCNASGHDGKLYNCDFYQSTAAGDKLKSMLELGKSKPWPEAMAKLTGSGEISTASILKYFRPLGDWLQKTNKRTGAKIGWKGAKINWKS